MRRFPGPAATRYGRAASPCQSGQGAGDTGWGSDHGAGYSRLLDAEPETHDLTGTLMLYDPLLALFAVPNAPGGYVCSGSGDYADLRGYADIQEVRGNGFQVSGGGSPVVVRDGDGDVLATSTLAPRSVLTPTICVLEFTVTDLPEADVYVIEVGDRGGVTYAKATLERAGWRVDLTVGPPS